MEAVLLSGLTIDAPPMSQSRSPFFVVLQQQTVHCPNCGNLGLRQQFLLEHEVCTETACPVCDYLLVSCHRTGRVLDSYICLGEGIPLQASVKQYSS